MGAGARHARTLGTRRVGHLSGGVRPPGPRRVSGADLGQADRGDRSRRGSAVEAEEPQVVYLRGHWDDVGPLVAGRMFFWCGTMDDFFYDNPTRLFEEQTGTFSDPKADFSFEWGEGQGHGWMPMTIPELMTDMATYMAAHAPEGTDTSGWMPQ